MTVSPRAPWPVVSTLVRPPLPVALSASAAVAGLSALHGTAAAGQNRFPYPNVASTSIVRHWGEPSVVGSDFASKGPASM